MKSFRLEEPFILDRGAVEEQEKSFSDTEVSNIGKMSSNYGEKHKLDNSYLH